MALELLTKPSLLFLDEPTSGLDPGLDKSVMEQMRDLAHDGRTVIVVTHSVANLDVCDRLLVLVPGGKVAFFGPPQDGLRYFGEPGWAEVFQAFDRYPDRDWAGEFAASAIYEEYVTRPQSIPAVPSGPKAAGTPAPVRGSAFHQIGTLCRRYARVIASDRGYLLFTALMPIIIGALIHLIAGSKGLGGPPGTNTSASTLLILLIVGVCLSGTVSSIWELVKERTIYVRERAAGLSSGAYLGSKLIVLGVIAVVQAALLAAIGLLGHPLPRTGSFLTGAPFAELLIGIAVLCVASMCLGLMVSALVSTTETGHAVPRADHHGAGHPVRRCGLDRGQDGAGADRVPGPGALGLRRRRLHLRPQSSGPGRVRARRSAVAAPGQHLADGHGRDDRAVPRLCDRHLVAAEPAEPGPPQVGTEFTS